MSAELEQLVNQVLDSIVRGYQARVGMKDRARSLSEYEIARRLGVTEYSYAAFDDTEEHAELREALQALLERGLIERGGRSGRYDTYQPATVTSDERLPSGPSPASVIPIETSLAQISATLDQMLGVLRSIDHKLGPE